MDMNFTNKSVYKYKVLCYNRTINEGTTKQYKMEEMKMAKYFVIATHYDDNKKAQVKYIAGQFDSYTNAMIFETAYNKHFDTKAKIVEEQELVN